MAVILALETVPDLHGLIANRTLRFTVLGTLGLIGGIAAVLPTLQERRRNTAVRRELRSRYGGLLVRDLDAKLDNLIGKIGREFSVGRLTASIMVPSGHYVLKRARQLRIVTASQLLRPLPSMALVLDWGEGLAGRIWKEGTSAAAIAVLNTPDDFSAKKIERISTMKRRDGSFGHEAGVAVPVNWVDPARSAVEFLGVLSIGTDQAADLDVFRHRDFLHLVYEFVRAEIAHDLKVYCMTYEPTGRETP